MADVAVADWFRHERQRRGWSAAQAASRIVKAAEDCGEQLALSQQAVSKFELGGLKSEPDWLKFARTAFDAGTMAALPAPAEMAAHLDLVPIAEIDQDYGLGGTFADGHVEVQIHHFPRAWVESITPSPASMLTIARGKGDSMDPTIRDRDMVIIDRSRRKIDEADAIWALTVGDIGMIKRLRLRGSMVVIQSDNDRVSDETVHADEINIVGRIVFIGRRT